MRFVVVKRTQSALAGLGLILAACGSQPAPAAPEARPADVGAVAESAPTLSAPAAQAAADAHAEHGSCGHAHGAPGAAAQGCCGGGACGAAEGHGAACGASEHKAPAQPALADRAAAESQLVRIHDPSEVCMVRNHFMGRPQLSVSAGSSTYYGCCAGCANRLLQDESTRVAIDPVSHHPVDKALAVLAKTPRGSVLYFENEQTLSAFRAGFN